MKLLILTDGNAFWQNRCASALKAAAKKRGIDCVVSSRGLTGQIADAAVVFGLRNEIVHNAKKTYSISSSTPDSENVLIKFDKIFVPSFFSDCTKEKIVPTGIPVPAKSELFDRTAARNYLVVPKDQKILLISADGMSVPETGALYKQLLKKAKCDFTVWIFSDRESEKKNDLEALFSDCANVQIIAYTEKIDIYIKAADVMITSQDDNAIAEASLLSTPLVICKSEKSKPGRAADYFAENEMAYLSFGAEDTASKAARLLENKILCERMLRFQNKRNAPDAADRIIDSIIKSNDQ